MRVKSQIPISCHTGWLGIANSSEIAIPNSEQIHFIMSIRNEYKVYRSENCIVVDSVPRVFRAKGRTEFSHVGTVKSPEGEIFLFQISENEIPKYSDLIKNNDLLVLPIACDELVTWSEQTEKSTAQVTGLLCISDKVRLVLSKPEATRIHELEQLVAQALRNKGDKKQIALHNIKHELLNMHFDGVKDDRLEMLSSSIKLNLPSRGRYKREEALRELDNAFSERKQKPHITKQLSRTSQTSQIFAKKSRAAKIWASLLRRLLRR